MAEPVSLDDAVHTVLEQASRLPEEPVRLEESVGRYLAAPAQAQIDVPPFASSAMDGYAVRAADVPGTLQVIAHVAAGRPTGETLHAGQAAEISTGGAVPAGADTVVPVERVSSRDNNRVEIPAQISEGANIRPRGGDIAAGELISPEGTLIGPTQLAALATAGISSVRCPRRARVCVLTTGTELREPGEPLAPGEIYESNGRMLVALLAREGADVTRLPGVPDDEAAQREALEQALQADIVVTSGGVSVGPHDLVRRVLQALGVRELFWGVAVRPGKPVSFGVRDGTLVFGLPGNPVSSLVGAVLLVAPALRALHGDPAPAARSLPGVLGADVPRNPAREDLVRALCSADGDQVVLHPIAGQDSHMIVRASRADALVRVGRGTEPIPAGASVRYYPLDARGV
jgi:molybdopterin molybdotransferase